MEITTITIISALIGGVFGTISSYFVTKKQLNQKARIWSSEFAVNYSKLYFENPLATKVLLKQFAIGLIVHIDNEGRTIDKYYITNHFRLSIGRNEENDIILDDNYVSRDHGFIFCKGSNVYYQDLSPLNKTTINNKEFVKCYKLNNEDIIKLGDNTLKYIKLV